MRKQFRCMVCGELIAPGEGRVEIQNGNPELGQIGGYPRESQDAWEKLSAAEQMRQLGIPRDPAHMGLATTPEEKEMLEHTYSGREMADLLMKQMERPRNIAVSVHHVRCDRNPDADPYYFDASEIETFEGLMTWLDHLHEKDWFGREEVYQMLHIWHDASEYAPEMGE